MKKKKKKISEKTKIYLKKYSDVINHHKNDLFMPSISATYNNVVNNSWFRIEKFNLDNSIERNIGIDLPIDKNYKVRNCIEVELILNKYQRKIINRWFNAYTKMYNETLKIIKESMKNNNGFVYIQNIHLVKNIYSNFFNQYDEIQKIQEMHNNELKYLFNKYQSNQTTENINNLFNLCCSKKIKETNKELLKLMHNVKNRTYGTMYAVNVLNKYELRSLIMKNIKDKIIEESTLEDIKDKRTHIYSHILDTAIKLVCSNYESAMTNYNNGNIKHFRMRYWKYNKINKAMEIENSFFKKNSICPEIFGNIQAIYNKIPFNLGLVEKDEKYKTDCKLCYNSKNGKYKLFIPKKDKLLNNNNPDEIVSIDLGIRTFAACMAKNSAVKIGDNASENIKNYLIKIDKLQKIKSSDLNKNKINRLLNKNLMDDRILNIRFENWKKKKEEMYRRKIKNFVTELHWKTINYLTNNYRNILVGDLSIKSISSKLNKINKMTKRIGYCFEMYKFRQRLEHKSKSKSVGYKLINESHTSKMCNSCGTYNSELTSEKIFECDNCKIIIDRDMNGARGIYMKYYMSI